LEDIENIIWLQCFKKKSASLVKNDAELFAGFKSGLFFWGECIQQSTNIEIFISRDYFIILIKIISATVFAGSLLA